VLVLPAALVSPADLCGYSLPNDLFFLRLHLRSRNHALHLERSQAQTLLPALPAPCTKGSVIIPASTLPNPVIRCLGCDCPIVRWMGLIILFSYSGNFVPINYFSLNSNSWLSLERN